MNTVQQIIQKKERNILSIFFTAGFPRIDDTTKIIKLLSDNHVDFIEVGLPYSDPLADGKTIQNSSAVALKNGINLDLIFKQLKSIKNTNQTPLVLMGYLNQIIQYGEEKFCQAVQHSGVDTVIIPDLPIVAYQQHYHKLFEKYGITNVFLITPNTSEERIRQIDQISHAFIYMVASASITGAKGEIAQTQINYFERIKHMRLKNKRIVGFGISNKSTFDKVCEYAHGAIIGSAFIDHLDKMGIAGIHHFIKQIKGQ